MSHFQRHGDPREAGGGGVRRLRCVALRSGAGFGRPAPAAPEVLQYLALLDPADALAGLDRDARIVVLVDALDEVLRFRGAMSVLDWLEQAPEVPSNVRLVLTSRPHPRLDQLVDVRAGQVELLKIDPGSEDVKADARTFARRALTEPAVVSAGRVARPRRRREDLAAAADGNLAYLAAHERALRGAIEGSHGDLLDALLRLDALPTRFGHLYAVFLRSVRQDIQQLGLLEIEVPTGPGDELAPAWEGVGQRVLGVLAVARAPLTLQQLMTLGSIRVYPSAAAAVLERFTPFLDHVDPAWRLFHPSIADFIATDSAPEARDFGIVADEWHRRVTRAYRQAPRPGPTSTGRSSTTTASFTSSST